MKKKKIILNWKLEKDHEQTVSWIQENLEGLKRLSESIEITVFPTYVSLEALKNIFAKTDIKLGSQGCAQEAKGPYVGEVSVKSLKQLDCHYCLVNHCGQNDYKTDNNYEAAIKTKLLLENNIEPVFCVGETYEQTAGDIRFRVLENQLQVLTEIINQSNFKKITLAYEPIWAIGTEESNPAGDANLVFEWLSEYSHTNWPNAEVTLLYGGGINEKNVHQYQAVEHLDGLLLGKGSLDFQNLKKIVELYKEPA